MHGFSCRATFPTMRRPTSRTPYGPSDLTWNGTVMSPAEAASRASVGPVMVVVPIVVLLVAYMLLSQVPSRR